jgi:hypothetical protein
MNGVFVDGVQVARSGMPASTARLRPQALVQVGPLWFFFLPAQLQSASGAAVAMPRAHVAVSPPSAMEDDSDGGAGDAAAL